MHADKAAWQGKGIDRIVGNPEKFERPRRIRTVADQPVARGIQIVTDIGIVNVSGAGANLAHDALTELALLGGGQRSLRHIAQVGQFVRKAQYRS